jgi:hypothetical protein
VRKASTRGWYTRADAEGVSLNTLAVALLAAGMGDSDG